jgi:hypothetical protein
MPLKGTNIFAQLVDLIDQKTFHQTVRKHNGNKYAKGFTCWEQFVSLMFCHLSLKHGPKKSTLACKVRYEF